MAHPDYRNEILNEAKARNYIYAHQKSIPSKGTPLPGEYEIVKPLADGTQLFFRPIRPTDDKLMRDMCYALSERSIAFRFFKPIKSFPHKFIQDFTNCDFSKDMVIVGLIQDMGGEQMIGLGSYHFNQATNKAEVSFLVRDGWQDKGMGTDLLNCSRTSQRSAACSALTPRCLNRTSPCSRCFTIRGSRSPRRRWKTCTTFRTRSRNKKKTRPPQIPPKGGIKLGKSYRVPLRGIEGAKS